jgi:hypothetical protein
MVEFEDFISSGEVRKQEVDKNLNRVLIESALDRKLFLEKEIKTPKYVIENVYDTLRELIEARLALEGYKSYSHQATILFLKKFKQFNEFEISFLENLRKFRHGLKYYGKLASVSDSLKVLKFFKDIFSKLKIFAENKK